MGVQCSGGGTELVRDVLGGNGNELVAFVVVGSKGLVALSIVLPMIQEATNGGVDGAAERVTRASVSNLFVAVGILLSGKRVGDRGSGSEVSDVGGIGVKGFVAEVENNVLDEERLSSVVVPVYSPGRRRK